MKRSLLFLFCVFAFGISLSLHAQTPRVVLVEEGTNASCGPCAAQNPTFEAYLTSPIGHRRIIPLIYHANFPGADVMYTANPTMHNGRVQYYTINAVPTAFVNGRRYNRINASYDGAPADTVGLSTAVNAVPASSPLTIDVKETVTGSNVSVDVTVTSASEISNKKLRIAVTEGFHYYSNAGSNGETDFYYIARQMLPSHAGLDISLASGESKSFTQSYTINSQWTASEIYVIAFIQDEATKEVLQVATDKPLIEFATNESTTFVAASPTPKIFTGSLNIPLTGEYSVTIDKNLPTGWTSEVSFADSTVQSLSKLNLTTGSKMIEIKFTPNPSKNRMGEVTVHIKGPRASSLDQKFKLYAKPIDVGCLIRDEGVAQIATNYQQAFEQGTRSYAMIPSGEEKLFDLKTSFGALVCEVGKDVLYQEDIDLIKSYITNGGRLYLIGAEIAWGLADPQSGTSGFVMDIPFLNNFLHANYVSDDNPNGTLRGFTGDPIGDGLTFSIITGVQNQDTPDQLSPRDGAIPIFYYGTNQNDIAGIRWEDKKTKLVYLGFGLEGMGTLSSRAEVLKRGIEWLLLPTDVVDVKPLAENGFDVFPNPLASLYTVSINTSVKSRVELRLYDLTGRTVSTLLDREVEPSESKFTFDGSSLRPGKYLLHLRRGNEITSRLLTVIR